MLCIHLVCGFRDENLQRTLLADKDLILPKVADKATAAEATAKNLMKICHPENVHFIKGNNQQSKQQSVIKNIQYNHYYHTVMVVRAIMLGRLTRMPIPFVMGVVLKVICNVCIVVTTIVEPKRIVIIIRQSSPPQIKIRCQFFPWLTLNGMLRLELIIKPVNSRSITRAIFKIISSHTLDFICTSSPKYTIAHCIFSITNTIALQSRAIKFIIKKSTTYHQ